MIRQSDHIADWWHPGSDFCRELDTLLQTKGASARCWAHLGRTRALDDDPLWGLQPFAWTGANSELARHDAGRALAAQLARLEVDPSVERYHLIGHSHGGNVILQALRALSSAPTKLGQVVFLGTPVLSFRHAEALDVRWVAIPLYMGALIGSVWAFQRWPDNQFNQVFWGTVVVAIVIALLAELLQSNSRARRSGSQLYGSGRPSAFRFDGDEAIDSLTLAQGIARDPKGFIDQFAASPPLKPFAFTPTAAPQQSFESRIQGTGAYTMLQALETPPVPVFVPMYLAQSPGVRARAGGFREKVTDQLQWMGKAINAATSGFAFKPILIGVLWICAALPLLVMLTAAAIYSFVTRTASAIIGRMVLGGAKILGRWALPVLVRKTTMGADFGRFLEVQLLPPGVAEREKMSVDLCKEAAAVGSRYGQDAGQAMLRAVAKMDAFAIKEQVTNDLTNAALAHSYYYVAAEVKERIAQMIAPLQKVVLPPPLGLNTMNPTAWSAWIKNASGSAPTSTVLEGVPRSPPSK